MKNRLTVPISAAPVRAASTECTAAACQADNQFGAHGVAKRTPGVLQLEWQARDALRGAVRVVFQGQPVSPSGVH